MEMAIATQAQILKVLKAFNPWWVTGAVHPDFTKHYRRFAYAGRAYQKHGALFFARNSVLTVFVFIDVNSHGVLDFVFSLFYIHKRLLYFAISNLYA